MLISIFPSDFSVIVDHSFRCHFHLSKKNDRAKISIYKILTFEKGFRKFDKIVISYAFGKCRASADSLGKIILCYISKKHIISNHGKI